MANKTIPAISGTLSGGESIYRLSSGGWSKLSLGASQTIMTSNGTIPGWSTLAQVLAFLGTTNGSVPMCVGGTWQAFAPGAANLLLQGAGVSTVPAWVTMSAALAGLGTGSNGAIPMCQAGAWSAFASGSTNNVLKGAGVGSVPSWSTVAALLAAAFGSTSNTVLGCPAGTWAAFNWKRVETLIGSIQNANPAGSFSFTPTSMLAIAWDVTNSAVSIGFHNASGQASALLATGVSTTTGILFGGGSGANTWACTLAATPSWTRVGTGTHVTWYLLVGFE